MTTPKSVLFESPPPAYVFQGVCFQATIKLVDAHKTKVTGHATPLQLTLRFHDTYDVVADQSFMVVDATSTTVEPTTGTCRLNVMLTRLTAASDGRAFCIEVRSAAGDLESAFSSPIHVIKEKLVITEQPPDVWFKDEGGREKCMTVAIVLEAAPGVPIEDRVVPLQLRLLYESGALVANQQILRLFPDMRPNMSRGRVTISFRIDDVSKNHQGQSFILEVAPEKQETSQMFQDIAPVRTTVIAIRSKRNKRKLNGLTPRNGAMTPSNVTPRANGPMMMMATSPTAAAGAGGGGILHNPGPSPSQRPRHLTMMPIGPTTPVNNPYVLTPHPAATGRLPPSMMPMATTWSSHIQPQSAAQTPIAAQVSTPVSTPMASASNSVGATGMTVEWKLAGFEMNSDGTSNVSRPIYRCVQCRRLVDVEMMNHGQDLHAMQCSFAATHTASAGVLYRSQMEGAATGTPQHQQQISMQPQMHNYYSNTTPRQVVYPASVAQSTTPRHPQMVPASSPLAATSAIMSSGSNSTAYQASTANPIVSENMVADSITGSSSKGPSVDPAAASSHRPVLTISPFMNKVATVDTSNEQQSSDPAQQIPDSESNAGNLFASNAFRNQMGLDDVQSASPTVEEKMAFLSKPLEDKTEPDALVGPETFGLDNPQSSADPDAPSLIVSVGNNAMYNEMTSMGINVDNYLAKSTAGGNGLEPGNPMADFSELTAGYSDEDQVFYILARMYTNAQSGKLGLPAFDQFQRMLGFYTEVQVEAQTQVVFHSIVEVGLTDKEQIDITSRFMDELQQNSDAVHSLPKYQNLVLLREDALMYYWSQSIQCLS